MNHKRITAKDRILTAATTIFSQKGYSETTISEISREAGVSDASVYQLFGGKEDLFTAVGSQRLSGGMPHIKKELFGVKGALNQLRKFVWVYVLALMEDKEVTKIVLLHLKTSKAFLESEHYRDVQNFYRVIAEIIETGQKTGEIRADVNPHTARSVLIGTIEHLLIRWLLKDCSYDLWPYVEEAYELIEKSLCNTPRMQIHISYDGPESTAFRLEQQHPEKTKRERTKPKRGKNL
jgi:TetR/AcrR family fatty acid metabolism transcriptional regulator